MKDNKIKKPIVVLGDFNTNLSATFEEAPELRAFKLLGLEDAWLNKYSDRKNNPGYTEDTDVNHMRWNVKLEKKQKRIDGIFHTKNVLKTNEIVVLGKEPVKGVPDELMDKFKTYRIPPKATDADIKFIDGKTMFWPSDHFAVVANLEFVDKLPEDDSDISIRFI
jgi:hypothetical protein